MANKIDKSMFKMGKEELNEYLHFRKLGFVIENKKGKGSYTRKEKHKKDLSKMEDDK